MHRYFANNSVKVARVKILGLLHGHLYKLQKLIQISGPQSTTIVVNSKLHYHVDQLS